jgi:hypothetical protein
MSRSWFVRDKLDLSPRNALDLLLLFLTNLSAISEAESSYRLVINQHGQRFHG